MESGTKCIRANQDTFERLAVYDLDLNNGLPQTKRSKQEVNKFMMMRLVICIIIVGEKFQSETILHIVYLLLFSCFTQKLSF